MLVSGDEYKVITRHLLFNCTCNKLSYFNHNFLLCRDSQWTSAKRRRQRRVPCKNKQKNQLYYSVKSTFHENCNARFVSNGNFLLNSNSVCKISNFLEYFLYFYVFAFLQIRIKVFLIKKFCAEFS